jgi:hypothetical protein
MLNRGLVVYTVSSQGRRTSVGESIFLPHGRSCRRPDMTLIPIHGVYSNIASNEWDSCQGTCDDE